MKIIVYVVLQKFEVWQFHQPQTFIRKERLSSLVYKGLSRGRVASLWPCHLTWSLRSRHVYGDEHSTHIDLRVQQHIIALRLDKPLSTRFNHSTETPAGRVQFFKRCNYKIVSHRVFFGWCLAGEHGRWLRWSKWYQSYDTRADLTES